MKIGIDACCWSNRRGFGRYTRELVTHMVSGCGEHEFTLVVDRATAEQGVFPDAAKLEVVSTRQQPTQAASAEGSRCAMDLWRLGRAASRLRLDLFFFPAVYTYYPVLRRIPIVVTFHDTIAEDHPELVFSGWRARLFWNLKTWLALRQADQVLTVSQSAKSQIVKTLGYPESAIHVILEGPGDEFRVMDDRGAIQRVLEQYQLPGDTPLILYVGGISPHKNLHGLLHALSKVRETCGCAWQMVIVGDYKDDSFFGCYQEMSELCRRLGLGDRVTFTGYVPNEHLVALYNAAVMLVLPSFNEGFGLPVVEAMACGLPVTASNRGSLPEVLGPAGVLFDPEDHGAMVAALIQLLVGPDLRLRLRLEGLRRAAQFSWKTSARQAIQLFEETVCGASAIS